jgi:hypothetical protein
MRGVGLSDAGNYIYNIGPPQPARTPCKSAGASYPGALQAPGNHIPFKGDGCNHSEDLSFFSSRMHSAECNTGEPAVQPLGLNTIYYLVLTKVFLF